MEKLPISVIIIAKNEQDNLPRALGSVKEWASEIIAVINDCTDNTEQILLSWGARVYHHDWHGFVAQKNLALGYAKEPWIFSIDADEEVTPRMFRDIRDLVLSDHQSFSGASFCRKSWFLGKWIKHGDWYPDRVVRLFRNGDGLYDGNYVHEKLVINGQIKLCNSNLLHYSVPDLYTFLHKTESFSRNFAIANLNKDKFFYFGTVARSLWKFFRCYIIKLGFLDGYRGLIIAAQSGYSTFFKYNVLLAERLNKISPTLDAEDK